MLIEVYYTENNCSGYNNMFRYIYLCTDRNVRVTIFDERRSIRILNVMIIFRIYIFYLRIRLQKTKLTKSHLNSYSGFRIRTYPLLTIGRKRLVAYCLWSIRFVVDTVPKSLAAPLSFSIGPIIYLFLICSRRPFGRHI